MKTTITPALAVNFGANGTLIIDTVTRKFLVDSIVSTLTQFNLYDLDELNHETEIAETLNSMLVTLTGMDMKTLLVSPGWVETPIVPSEPSADMLAIVAECKLDPAVLHGTSSELIHDAVADWEYLRANQIIDTTGTDLTETLETLSAIFSDY